MELFLLLLLGGVGYALYWYFTRPKPQEQDPVTFGSAQWETEENITAHGGPAGGGLLVGMTHGDNRGRPFVTYRQDKHLLTVAPTRSGKGVGCIVPNLLSYPGSVVVVDPKGENAWITAERRRQFGPVIVYDPFAVSGEKKRHRFNPVALIRQASAEDQFDLATLIADALVVPGHTSESFWSDEARALLAGLILHVATQEGEVPSLSRVRELLTQKPTDWADTLVRMGKNPGAGGLVARAANRHKQKSEKEAASVMSSAQQHTHFLDSPALRVFFDVSDVDVPALWEAGQPISFFLVLPPDKLEIYNRALRLMISLFLHELAQPGRKQARPVVFFLDEMAQLGRLKSVENAYGLMAGYGVQLWAFLQDLSQLQDLYGSRWQTFIANSGMFQVFGTRDLVTAEYVSKKLGNCTMQTKGLSIGNTAQGSSSSRNWSDVGRPLFFPDEVMRLYARGSVVFMDGQRIEGGQLNPMLVQKIRYFDHWAFVGTYRADPQPARQAGSEATPMQAAAE